MKLTELFESKESVRDLAHEFIKDAEKNVSDWFGSGTFDEICTEPGNCAMVSEQFVDWMHEKGLNASMMSGHVATNPDWAKRAGVRAGTDADAHTVAVVDDTVVDFTARQFDPKAPFPKLTTVSQFESEWKTTED